MSEHGFVDVSILATSRQRATAAILDKLPDDDRAVLVALLFEEFDEMAATVLWALRAARNLPT